MITNKSKLLKNTILSNISNWNIKYLIKHFELKYLIQFCVIKTFKTILIKVFVKILILILFISKKTLELLKFNIYIYRQYITF